MLITLAVLVLFALVTIVPRLISLSRGRDATDRLGNMSERWLAEHRSSRHL